jgi:hypothetical protein
MLAFAKDGNEHSIAEVIEFLSQKFNITDEDGQKWVLKKLWTLARDGRKNICKGWMKKITSDDFTEK